MMRACGSAERLPGAPRFWLATGLLHDGRAVWIGDATFDQRAGVSHRSLRPTHHIAPNVDHERDTLLADLTHAGQIAVRFQVTGMGPQLNAYNAEGDRFDTDGEMDVAVVAVNNIPVVAPRVLPPPTAIALENRVWSWTTATDNTPIPR